MKKTPFSCKTIFIKNPSIKTIKTEEGIIISSADNKRNCIYYLEKGISTKIWKLINGKRTLIEIKSIFKPYNKKKYWQKGFERFIQNMLSKNLIIIKK